MKTTNNDDNGITVGFDKSKWSVESPESFGGVMGILKTLFRLTNSKVRTISLSGHKRVRSYTNGPDSLQIYYFPRSPSQPPARIVYNSNNNRLSFFSIITEELLEDNFSVGFSNNGTSLNIGFPEDVKNLTTNNSTLDKDSSKVMKKVMEEIKTKDNLLQKLDIILKGLGYKFQNDGPVKSKNPKYGYVTTFKTNWFRIYINHSPVNSATDDSGFKFATIQIDGFNKENKKNSCWVLLFILKILKAYKVTQTDDFYEYPILPSQLEVAFDFYGYKPEFIFELTSQINSRKLFREQTSSINSKKITCGWTNKSKKELNPYTVEDDKNSLVSASHYIGRGEDDNYQVSVYNKPKFTRLEFRLKDKGLRPYTIKKRKNRISKGRSDPNIDSVEDLFTKDWILDFLKKISFARPNKKAFERIDSSFHPLADISLKTFISKVPTDKKNNLSRCLKKNNELKEVLVTAANGFHDWLRNLYLTSSILVNPKYKIADTFEVVYDADSNIPTKYPVVQNIDLKELFRQLPANTTVESQELKDAIRFSILDYQHNLLAYIIIGESPERFMEPGDIYYVEKFKDVFRESPNQINTKKV